MYSPNDPPATETVRPQPTQAAGRIAVTSAEVTLTSELLSEAQSPVPVSLEHTAALRTNVLERGMSIRRGIHGNVPNETAFRAAFGLDRDATEAIGEYKGASAMSMNNYLRGSGPYPYICKRAFETLLRLFSSDGGLPATQGGEIVFRGLPIKGGPMDTIAEPGFMSCSVFRERAASFAGTSKRIAGSGYLMRMLLPEGVKYIPSGGSEGEAILQPGLTIVPHRLIARGSREYEAIMDTLDDRDRFRTMEIDGVIDAHVELRNDGKS